jgi:hypothetical protein
MEPSKMNKETHEDVKAVLVPGDGNDVHVYPQRVHKGEKRHVNARWSNEDKDQVLKEFKRLEKRQGPDVDKRRIAFEAQKVLPEYLQRWFPEKDHPEEDERLLYTGNSVLAILKRWESSLLKERSPLLDLFGRNALPTSELNVQAMRQIIEPLIRHTGEQNALLTMMLERMNVMEAELKQLRKSNFVADDFLG